MRYEQGSIFVRRAYKDKRFYIDNEIVDNGYLRFLRKEWPIYTVLARHANAKAQKCFLSYETIMRESGITNRNSLARALDRFQTLNMIAIERMKGLRSNVYVLIDSSCWKPVRSIAVDTIHSVSKIPTNQYQNQQSSSISGDTLNRLNKSTIEIKDNKKENFTESKGRLIEKFKWPK